MTYKPPSIDNVEQIEYYRAGGFHPVHLGDTFADGRYHIRVYGGYGGFSTVWLARDKARNQLVSLEILMAEASNSCQDAEVLQALKVNPLNHPGRRHIMLVLDHFAVHGPNGSHMCLVSQVAGPSIVDLSYSPGQMAGSRRLRGDVARSFARQTVQAVGFLHAAGIMHGG
jgi:serine/threonine-protein kinase SRPK3